MPAPRLAPEIPFPAYSYVTGRFPHPSRDAAGHSFGHQIAMPAALDPSQWQDSRDFLHAIDLFNYGYYWESHETWESLWHAAGREGVVASLLKGLIKLAAAGVKAREGRTEGVKRHARRAQELFAEVRNEIGAPEFCGLALDDLIAKADRIAQNPPIVVMSDLPVVVVFDFTLEPGFTTPQNVEPDRQ